MKRSAHELLREIYGYDAFRGQQQEIVAAVCAGRDCLVLMPTGGGKSLCYQLPALLQEGLGIVVSPLIALMQDQVSALRQLGVAAGFLNSTQGPSERAEVRRQIHTGELQLLYVAPERILQEDTLAFLANYPVSVIAIDEAHCVSSWGHDFRQDYLALNRLKHTFPGVPRMALTATADPRTREDIVARLELDAPLRFVDGFDRPNIRYRVAIKTDPKRQLREFLESRRGESGIVYCLSRRSVDATASALAERGFTALPYHAGLPAEVRAEHQGRFLREDAVVMVATIAFGMGIDKPDVRFVAHMDLPKSVEAYYQETGRAGRDGRPADAWMIYGLQDVVRLSQMVGQSQAEEMHKRTEQEKLYALLGWCEITRCRRAALLGYFGEEAPAACGNCDICLEPPATWDGTERAQMLLSCVYRTGQRFGAGHVIDVLRGAETDKLRQHGHERLSTFGIGSGLSVAGWRSVVRQLIVQGYLIADPERYGALRLTGDSRALLRGEVTLRLREEPQLPLGRKRPATGEGKGATEPRVAKAAVAVAPADEPLWDALRARRKALADEQGVPPYVIFHDATLREMVQLRPTSADRLLAITGVGAAKLERYGAFFLEVIRQHGSADSVPGELA
ncbi:MAG: DNA helicase RecQ [Pseudomonadales bacterium]